MTTPALWSAQAHMPSVIGRQIQVVSAKGSYLTTDTGAKLFDGTASLWYANIGHGREEMAKVAYEQMKTLDSYHVFGRYTNNRAVELAEMLVSMAPIDDAKMILNSGGSDSIDVALKLARRYWNQVGCTSKKVIISREHSYHGLHAYGTSVAGLDFNREGYGSDSLVDGTERIDKHSTEAFAEAIERIGAENIAAYIAEPVMGTGGVHPPHEGYFAEIQRLCHENNILFIADEVITGFGRTGTMFASSRYALQPDIITFAKGVTSGYAALGGVFVAPRVWQPFFEQGAASPIYRHGTTYSGHPVTAALAMKNLEILEREGLVERSAALERILAGELAAIESHDLVATTRVGGFLGAIELHDEVQAEWVTDQILDLGFITRPLRGNAVQISPPFITTDQEVRDLVNGVRHVLDDIRSGKARASA
ncbi:MULTISPECIES: aspartate aminotransferase family protein [Vreelandella]|uniref:Aminotransferase class III-fold pyridoxal phosphate-dependent enzyme n=1 Tax=Vreelandella neptunia TaxID=115551 RepID=A0ABZ0YJV1_9GAMM|nr:MULTISPECIES: aminotransferase class III-fold pyridoxal phosphate-dependent enzyme [Halomonas]MDN3562652.1 aminotransferase class III-fold pyridoxal phosphate-dependent enzyme [Halomonas neptunia]UEQ03867.1 aminotransferase class III-fold pyridoxal phosphate-dependent enzyme [Halomonas profundus]WQH12385.1 aminotransferase class III-fold pyridoxal phosphate-dependent enzyme [Halomonas neptunia]